VPPTVRPSDGLLHDAELQRVVDLQVARDGVALVELLGSERPAIRARAALALASVQAPESLDALLIAMSEDPDLGVRRDAAFAVGQLGDAQAVAELAARLPVEPEASVRDRLLEALGKIADPAASDALLNAVVPRENEARRTLALSINGAVKNVVSKDAQDGLLERLDDPDPEVRVAAAYYFGRREDPSFWSPRAARIRQALDGYAPDDPAAMYLVQALGKLKAIFDGDRLHHWAQTAPDWRVRSDAMAALAGRELNTDTKEVLIAGLDDPSDHVALSAATTLGRNAHPPSAVRRIEDWISANPDRLVIVQPLMVLLANQNEREFIFEWMDALAPDDEKRWSVALEAMSYLGGSDAVERIGVAAASPLPDIAESAVLSLGRRWETDKRDPSTHAFYFGVLANALRTGTSTARFAAAQLLSDPAFRPLGSVDLFVEAYRAHEGDDDPATAAEMLRLMALSGSNEVEPVLREAAGHDSFPIRRSAAAGLSRLTGEELVIEPAPEEPPSDLPYDPKIIDWDYLAGLGGAPRISFETDRGRFVVELATEQAPHTVQTMARLAEEGRFDGVPFHRVVPNFVVQGGDVDGGTGRGGPGFRITSEFNEMPYVRGVIAMASAGKDTEGSQFFLTHTMLPHLDGRYTVFGWVVRGMDVVDRINKGDRIVRASLERDD
jgi:cyclophilin family peptidyl-prolyl cis-trans isomerase/HEAT repeat protein